MEIGLVVANTGSLGSDELEMQSRLATTLGHSVTLLDDAVSPTDASVVGKDAIFISRTAALGSSGWQDCTVPICCFGKATTFKLSSSGLLSGTVNDNATTDTTHAGHPLMAGLSGSFALTAGTSTTQQYVASTGLAAAVRGIIHLPSEPTRFWEIACEAGAALHDAHTAPARRVHMMPRAEHVELFTEAGGWTLFDAAVDWLLDAPASPWSIADNGVWVPAPTPRIAHSGAWV